MIFALLTFGLAALFSLVLPLSVVFMRDAVKRQRQGYIRILDKMFGPPVDPPPPKQESPAEGIVAGFEFVKSKYFMQQSDYDLRVPGGFAGVDDPATDNVSAIKNNL